MYYLLILISVIGYTLQGTLLVRYSRSIDSLSLAVYRNLSLIFIMSPLLLFTSIEQLRSVPDYIHLISLAGITGTIGLASMFLSYRYLAIGISSGLRQAAGVFSALVLGIVFFDESLSGFQVLLIVFLLAGGFIIGKAKNPMPHLNSNAAFGILLSIFTGSIIALSFFLMSRMARELGPAISGYLWESSIGIFSLIFVVMRNKIGGHKIETISLTTFLKISLASSPTVLGTGAVAWAVTIGPLGLLRALSSAGIILTIIFSWLFYGEKLTVNQWIGIVLVSVSVFALRMI